MGGIKGILFDKDGTLIDFDRTWFGVADLMALKAADGSRSRADHLLIEAGYDFGTRRFKADSVFAAGTNAELIALWYPHQSPSERQATIEDYDRFVGENASAKPFGLPGVKDTIDCGPGRDHAVVDKIDVVENCELITYGSPPAASTPGGGTSGTTGG